MVGRRAADTTNTPKEGTSHTHEVCHGSWSVIEQVVNHLMDNHGELESTGLLEVESELLFLAQRGRSVLLGLLREVAPRSR